MTYLSEVIHGEDANDSENRLSQIFSATFNHSQPFQKTILRLLGLRSKDSGPFSSTTQKTHFVGKRRCQIDIVLQQGQQVKAIIENKIDAALTAAQLRKYDRIKEFKTTRRFCFVRTTNPSENYPANWQIVHWHHIHSLLLKECPDDFFSQNFMEILEEHNMIIPSKITRGELTQLAKAIHQLRYKTQPYVAMNSPVFETITNFNSMLSELWNMAIKDELIRKRTGRNFRCTPFLGCWFPGDDEPKRGTNLHVWIGAVIQLSKPYKHIKTISTGILFSDKVDDYEIVSDATDRQENWVGKIQKHKKDIEFPVWSKQVLNFWKHKLR